MLLSAKFLLALTLPPHSQRPQMLAGEGTGRTRERGSVFLPGSPGARWTQGTEQMFTMGSPLREPAPRQGHRQREGFPPPSLSQAMKRKLGQASSLLLLAGGRGRGPHCSFPQTRGTPFGERGGKGHLMGFPASQVWVSGRGSLLPACNGPHLHCPYLGATLMSPLLRIPLGNTPASGPPLGSSLLQEPHHICGGFPISQPGAQIIHR
jgi:hypothetical protein